MRGGAGSAVRATGAALLAAAAGAAMSQVPPLTTDGRTTGEGWHYAGLPKQKAPPTRFTPTVIDGVPAVRVDTQRSYGNWVWRPVPPMRVTSLRWRWRVDQGNPQSNLREKAGDDMPLRVCLGFAVPLAQLPFMDRQLLRMAGAVASEPLPTTTLCWVWDDKLPPGTVLASPFTRRVRYVVTRGRGQAPGAWVDEERDVAADFKRAYGDEIAELPLADAVMIGGDSDNTQQQTSGAVAALEVR
jgi:hypothetical protein